MSLKKVDCVPEVGDIWTEKNILIVTLAEEVGGVVRGAMTENRGLPHLSIYSFLNRGIAELLFTLTAVAVDRQWDGGRGT